MVRIQDEIKRQIVEGADRGESLVEVRLADSYFGEMSELSKFDGGFLPQIIKLLRTFGREIPTVATVRFHWPMGLGVDEIPLRESAPGLN